MQVFAYCAKTFAPAMAKVAGTVPVTCPPWSTTSFMLEWLVGHDLIFFDLHGLPGLDHWFEQVTSPMLGLPNRIVALTAAQIRQADLGGAGVFCLNCYLAGQGSPMLEALLDAGAGYVVGGEGLNWGGTKRLMGADVLGYWFRLALERGREPARALELAKYMVKVDLAKYKALGRERALEAAKDTLQFKLYRRTP